MTVAAIEEIGEYKIEVGMHSLDELKNMCLNAEEFDCVSRALIDPVLTVSNNTLPNDPWGFLDKWDNSNNPEGKNWWAEAVDIPAAWEHNDLTNNIKIGIIDSGFYYEHEELKDKIVPVWEVNRVRNNQIGNFGHGTFVAGIIGAEQNNKKGITGIVDKCTLICYNWKLEERLTEPAYAKEAESNIYAGFVGAILNGAKVVNFSLGRSDELADDNSVFSDEDIYYEGRNASQHILALLEHGYTDFICVQSSGNGAKNRIGIDAINNGLFCSITEENCAVSDKFSVKDIMDRVIIVGACDTADNDYQQTEFSNAGPQVSVCAPGREIYSCYNRKYEACTGTSAAAPIVSGITALIWSAAPDLSPGDIKTIICDESNTKFRCADSALSPNTDGDYGLINAEMVFDTVIEHINADNSQYDGKWYVYAEEQALDMPIGELTLCASKENGISDITVDIPIDISEAYAPVSFEKIVFDNDFEAHSNIMLNNIKYNALYHFTTQNDGMHNIRIEIIDDATVQKILNDLFVTRHKNATQTIKQYDDYGYLSDRAIENLRKELRIPTDMVVDVYITSTEWIAAGYERCAYVEFQNPSNGDIIAYSPAVDDTGHSLHGTGYYDMLQNSPISETENEDYADYVYVEQRICSKCGYEWIEKMDDDAYEYFEGGERIPCLSCGSINAKFKVLKEPHNNVTGEWEYDDWDE